LNPGNIPPGTTYTQTVYVNGVAQEFPVTCPYPVSPIGYPPTEATGLEMFPYEGYPPDTSGNLYVYNDNVPETYEIVCLGSNNCSTLVCSVSDSNVSVALSEQTYNSAVATFSAVTSTNAGTKQISCNLPNSYSPLVLGVYDAPPFITDAQLSAPLIPGGATVTLSIFGLHFGNSQGNGTLGVCSPGATLCTSTPDISFGSIIDWGCSNPGYCRIDVPVTAQSTATGSYDLVVNAAGTGGTGFVASPNGGQQRATSSNRGKVPTQAKPMITIYLLHGINQVGDNPQTGTGGAMDALKATLSNPDAGLQARYTVNSGFNFGECAANQQCTSSRYGDPCGIDAGGRSLARYIGANPPPGDIVLIGYSLGGLIARDMIAKNYLAMFAPSYTGGKVAGLITLGTPHLGYPYSSLDDLQTCPLLNRDLAGGWWPLASPPIELPPLGGSTFFDSLRQSWGGTSVPYWLAAAGTAYSNSLREFPTPLFLSDLASTPGCISPTPTGPLFLTGPAYSDGIVCRDSALYQEPSGFSGWVTPPLPTETLYQDPTHHYVHTFLNIFGLTVTNASLFGVIKPMSPPYNELYRPPFPGDLVNAIVSTLNAH
jgi:pimeloyl-ACP methyl ester carboxylesterase